MIKKGVVLAVLAFVTFVNAVVLTIDKSTINCGEQFNIAVGSEYVITGTGESPVVDCSYGFKGELKDNCMGLCYNIKSGSFFNDAKVSLMLVSGNHSMVYMQKKVSQDEIWCGKEMTLSATLTVANDYQFNPEDPGYGFSLAVRCNQPGSDKSITFEEALNHLDGYEHGQEFKDNEHTTLVHGVLVVCGFASMFLVLLLVGHCYVKNSPNRGKKSHSTHISQPKESRLTDRQPENLVLLSVTTDPEKTPISASTNGRMHSSSSDSSKSSKGAEN